MSSSDRRGRCCSQRFWRSMARLCRQVPSSTTSRRGLWCLLIKLWMHHLLLLFFEQCTLLVVLFALLFVQFATHPVAHGRQQVLIKRADGHDDTQRPIGESADNFDEIAAIVLYPATVTFRSAALELTTATFPATLETFRTSHVPACAAETGLSALVLDNVARTVHAPA